MEINKIKIDMQLKKSMKQKFLFKMINKIEKTPASLKKEKKETRQKLLLSGLNRGSDYRLCTQQKDNNRILWVSLHNTFDNLQDMD